MITNRQRLEAVVEILISLLDEIDGDPDFEPEELEEQHDVEAAKASKSFAQPSADVRRLTGIEVLRILDR